MEVLERGEKLAKPLPGRRGDVLRRARDTARALEGSEPETSRVGLQIKVCAGGRGAPQGRVCGCRAVGGGLWGQGTRAGFCGGWCRARPRAAFGGATPLACPPTLDCRSCCWA